MSVELFDNTSSRSTAVISADEVYRYRLEREVCAKGLVIAYFGINGSTASSVVNDQTVKKLKEFTIRNGGRRFIIGNVFGFRAQDVKRLAEVADPVGPENAKHLAAIISDAELLVPMWGSRRKVPEHLHPYINALREQIFDSGKPVRIFDITASGDPMHPLMLSYETRLHEWKHWA